MTLKVRNQDFSIATCQTYVDLPKLFFYEKVLFSTQLSYHLMRKLLKKSWMVSTLELPHILEQNWLSRRFFTNQITVQWYTVLYYCTTRVTSFPSEQRGKEGGREPKKKEYIYSNHLPVTNFIYQCCKKMLFFRQISKLILTFTQNAAFWQVFLFVFLSFASWHTAT